MEPQINNSQTVRIDWIENEDLLRDEGVLFGITGVEPTEKTEVIRSYFHIQIAGYSPEVEYLQLKLVSQEKLIDEKREELLKKSNFEPDFKDSSNLLRTSVGLLVALIACCCNFYLIFIIFENYFSNPVIVASGVFLAGMFSLFSKTSFLYKENNQPESWKSWLEEIGLPICASVFVSAWTFQKYTIPVAFCVSFFVLGLFFFSGKLFYSYLSNLKIDFLSFLKTREQKKLARKTELDLINISVKITELNIEKDSFLEKKAFYSGEIAKIEARRDTLIKIFESEFYLSRNYRSQLSEKQINNLTDFKLKKG